MFTILEMESLGTLPWPWQVATPVVEEEAADLHRHFQSLAEADEAFNQWMRSASEKYGRAVHKRVHAKAGWL